jgi:hypothetical protein
MRILATIGGYIVYFLLFIFTKIFGTPGGSSK